MSFDKWWNWYNYERLVS